MSEFYEECRKYLQNLDFEKIITKLKNIDINKNEESNKYFFKLLLHLSHSTDRCHKQKLSKEMEVFIVANITCEHLINVPDKNKLFSALYYIIFYLLNRQCFKEAKIISKYMFPGKIIDFDDSDKSTIYYKIAALWHNEIFKKLDDLLVNSEAQQNIFQELSTFINFHLQILKFCDEHLYYIFKTIDAYIKKLNDIPLDTASPYLLQLFKYLSIYITNLKKISIEEAYNLMISSLAIVFYKRNDALNNSNILSFFRECDSYFLESLSSSSQCNNCYKFFRQFSINLFETNFMSKEFGEARFQKSFEILKILSQKYGIQSKIVTETVNAITHSFEVLFSNWEILISKQLADTNINCDNILKMGHFVKLVHNISKNRAFPLNYTCKKCPESIKCSINKDIYHTAMVTSQFIRVITKCSQDILTEEIFMIVKELIEDLLLIFYELKNSGCKYSPVVWDLCGKLIFNIGLISETKFPSQIEGLYEILCKQIICNGELNKKLSSFGLQDPVGTTLHRLCTSNFNQQKYKKAMTYAAYNALLSTSDSRKKKAFDMWANIKLKAIDSKDIPEFTIKSCLETDSEEIKKLNININLKDYDLKDLCLRELKSLFQVKGNVIDSMKKTLDELESTRDDLYFAQGVLLLCAHALQLSSREHISDYISKAIHKLKSCKSKLLKNHCLLANLNFFNIIEKLFVRSKNISQQIDDANFTVKTFKVMKGQQLENDIQNKCEVVPTYGGIDIQEDNRCANELKNVLNMWESCLETNAATLNDWESKFTLETIIICGEYCRLYKFHVIEEKSWVLAYKLAKNLKDFISCIYVIARSISLRCVNDKWIDDAKKYINDIKDSSTKSDADVIALFWLSLADLYFDCNKIEEAKLLLEQVKIMPNYDMLANSKIYIYAKDIEFRNCNVIYEKSNEEDFQQKYCHLLIEIHYLMINLHDHVLQAICRFWNLKFQLFACEQMFEAMYNIIVPMNNLLSFREISAHLSYGLKLTQKFGMTIRIAQYLKYFCYIDLLRAQMESCETRLQDLEHILCFENFGRSMNIKCQDKTNSPSKEVIIPANSSENSASPELKKKVFAPPDFLIHTPHCLCFICSNLDYQYLIFSCAHIRAQLYTSLKYINEADHYFNGAWKIKLKIEENEIAKNKHNQDYSWNRHQNLTLDSLMYLLDYSMFITHFEPERKEYALSLIEKTIDVAEKNNLYHHSICVYANELYYQHYIYDHFIKNLSISVPSYIPITITQQTVEGCVTPKQQIEKISRNPRRRKSPPAIAVPTIIINDFDNEENSYKLTKDTIKNPTIPRRTNYSSKCARIVRRKILADLNEESPNNKFVMEDEAPITRRSTRSSKKSLNSSKS